MEANTFYFSNFAEKYFVFFSPVKRTFNELQTAIDYKGTQAYPSKKKKTHTHKQNLKKVRQYRSIIDHYWTKQYWPIWTVNQDLFYVVNSLSHFKPLHKIHTYLLSSKLFLSLLSISTDEIYIYLLWLLYIIHIYLYFITTYTQRWKK